MDWARVRREGARGASLPLSVEGESPERELVGSEAVSCPVVPLFENRQRVVPAKGATRPSHEAVQGHEGKLEGKAQN